MMKKMVLMTMVAVVVAAGVAGGNVIAFQDGVNGYNGTADTSLSGYSSSGEQNYNYGGRSRVWVAGQPWNTWTAALTGLIGFKDLIGSGANQIPAGATINSVSLTLNDGGGETTMHFYRMYTDWVQGSSDGSAEDGASCFDYRRYQVSGVYVPGVDTWGACSGASGQGPCGSDWGHAGDGAIANWNPTADGATKTFNLTSYVAGDLSVLANGFLIFADGSWNYAGFASSENDTLSNRPLLTVDFTPVPEPISLILIGVGGAFGLCRRK